MNDTVTVVRHGCFNDLGQSEHYGLSCADGIYFLFDILNNEMRFFTNSNFLTIIVQPDGLTQGYNARKVTSEVYASFVLQCTVSGR